MRRFAYVADAVAASSRKTEKIALIAEYLRSLGDADLEAATRFFSGNPFAARDQRSLNAGSRTILAAAKRVWAVDERVLSEGYRESGDLGAALGPFVDAPRDLPLFESDMLTPAVLEQRFAEMADASGKNAGKKREVTLERLFRACRDPLEATYLIKIVTGDLRIGLREGLLHDAIAMAFGCTHRDVHRAAMASGDIGATAVAARYERLEAMHVTYGSPLGFMLASPIPYGETYHELGDLLWIAEDKFDGIRAQAHIYDDTVHLFSRNLNDVTASYPEIADGLRGQSRNMILDGEIIAWREGKALPFRSLQARLARKDVGPPLLSEIPLQYVVFDAIAIGDKFLIDEPLGERRLRLIEALKPNERVRMVAFERLTSGVLASVINERFEAARADGNEGLMLKRVDAPYVPGRRGKWWLKLKRELSTLDVVVVAVEWGNGRRAKVLSDYTFAVQDADGALLTIGKAYSGLTDAEIAELTIWFLEHQRGKIGRALSVEPSVVIEVAFDIVQRSTLHESGYSLRFPRIVRIREDKPVSQIDTLGNVDRIYEAMLRREQF